MKDSRRLQSAPSDCCRGPKSGRQCAPCSLQLTAKSNLRFPSAALDQRSDHEWPLARAPKCSENRIGGSPFGNSDKANAAVECGKKLRLRNIRLVRHPCEYRRQFPSRELDGRINSLRQHSRNVTRNSGTGNVRQALDTTGADRVKRALHVQNGGCEQNVSQ